MNRKSDNTQWPFITVVMPVRNEERFIGATLSQLLKQEYPVDKYEIIVVDGMSDDHTREIVLTLAKQNPQICLMDNLKRLSSSGRNIGIKNGKGDIFIIVDGHCFIPTNQYLKNVFINFIQSRADCLGRSQLLDPPGLTTFQKAVAHARASRIGHSGDSLIYSQFEGFISPVSNGFAYKKEVFTKIGYVDESFDACEDVEFNYRGEKAGLKCFMSPELTVKYYPRENIKELFKQMSRYGEGRNKFTQKHPETRNLNQFIPASFVLGLFLLTGICLLIGILQPFVFSSMLLYSAWLLFLLYGCYGLLILTMSIRLSAKNGWIFLNYLPLIYLTIHFGLGFGFLRKALFGKIYNP